MLPYLSRDRAQNFLASGGTLENAQAMATTPARARRNSMIVRATKSRSMRLSGSRVEPKIASEGISLGELENGKPPGCKSKISLTPRPAWAALGLRYAASVKCPERSS